MLDKKQVFFVHARPIRGLNWEATRGATFAVKYVNKVVGFKMAVALCGKKDNFNRKLGRQIAESRLKSTGWWKAKGLSSVISNIHEICAERGFIVPVRSLTYIEETFNGKGRKS